MSAQDRDFSASDKWENQSSKHNCKICKSAIIHGELESSLQSDGQYICPRCQRDLEKLEKE